MNRMFKKGLVLLAAAMMICAIGLCACSGGQSSNSSNSSSAEKSTATKIKVGYDKNKFAEGQSFTDSGSYNYVFKNAFTDLGWDAEFVGVNLPDVEKAINDGTIDCYAYGYTIQGREDKFAWTDAYMEATPILVHKKDNKEINNDSGFINLSSLTTKPTSQTIAIPAGAITYDVMSEADKATLNEIGTLKEYPGLIQCKEALDKGEVDMILTESSFLRPLFYSTEYARINIDESNTNTYGVAFKKGNAEMAKQMTDSLRKIWTNGSVKNSCETALRSDLSADDEAVQFTLKVFEDSWLLK